MVVIMKITDFWFMMLFSLVAHYQLLFCPVDGGSRLLYNVVDSVLEYVASHLKGQ
jgi:hypothetical protein